MNWANARRWLKRNYVFFSTFGVILLTIIGLFISYQTFKIAENEAKIAIIKDQPIFSFESQWVKTEGDSDFYSSTPINVTIFNIGPPLRRFNCIEREILVFNSYNESKNTETSTEIVIQNYFNDANTGAPTGKLFELKRIFPSNDSPSNIDDVLKMFTTNPGSSDQPQFLMYLWLNYIDYSGNVQNQYFQISRYEATPLSTIDGVKIFDKYLMLKDVPGSKNMFSHEINYASVLNLQNEGPTISKSKYDVSTVNITIMDKWYILKESGRIEYYAFARNVT